MMATYKHIMLGFNFDTTLRETYAMVSRIVGNDELLRQKPVISNSACIVISPMKFCSQSTRNVLTAGELGIPTTVTSAPMSGSTSPMTMAGRCCRPMPNNWRPPLQYPIDLLVTNNTPMG